MAQQSWTPVNYVIDLYQQEPGSFRRIVLLLSQSGDDGSRASAEEVLRHLGEGNTSVYSLTFSAPKSPPQFRPKNRVVKPRREASLGDSRQGETDDTSTPLGVALKAMRSMAVMEEGSMPLGLGGHPLQLGVLNATPGIFSVLDSAPQLGRAFTPQEAQPGYEHVVVLMDSLWRQQFQSDPGILGKSITLNGFRNAAHGDA